jgi:hypothetical protein
MAGSLISPIRIPATPRLRQEPPLPRMKLVEASVSLMGRSYRTMISEGASAEELIEKVARENGGGVARVFYPEFNTWEIVAVKIGPELIVKDDPGRVAQADFSDFPGAPQVREAAIIASCNAKGGIHFSLGSSGIPLAVTEDQGVVFPNAEELRIGRNISNISLWTTEVNIDPRTLGDLNRAYSARGGITVSEEALRSIASAHGGSRTDKLLLEDHLLVLNKDTGELTSVSGGGSGLPPLPDAGGALFPAPAPLPPTHSPAITPFQQPAGAFRPEPRDMWLTSLTVRLFDGRLADHLRVQFNPLPLGAVRKEPQKAAAPAPRLAFSVLSFNPKEKRGEASPPSQQAASKAEALKPAPQNQPAARSRKPDAETHSSPPPPPRSGTAPRQSVPPGRAAAVPSQALASWLSPRSRPISLEVPVSVSPLEKDAEKTDARPLPSRRGSKRKRRKKRPERESAKEDGKKRPDKSARKRPERAIQQRSRKGKKPRATKPPIGKHARAKKHPKPFKGPPRSGRMRGKTKPFAGKPGRGKKARIPSAVRRERKRKTAARLEKEGLAKNRRPRLKAASRSRRASESMERKRKKKLSRRLILRLLGLFQWKRRGRKLRMKKKSAV